MLTKKERECNKQYEDILLIQLPFRNIKSKYWLRALYLKIKYRRNKEERLICVNCHKIVYGYHNMFCILAFRGATSLCKKHKAKLVCGSCGEIFIYYHNSAKEYLRKKQQDAKS